MLLLFVSPPGRLTSPHLVMHIELQREYFRRTREKNRRENDLFSRNFLVYQCKLFVMITLYIIEEPK